ncbi:MAG: membrane protein insertase YidC [Varibaculum sp.]|nr:membrane protein insertase YidC [Varibaculum sp.]
MGWFDTLIYPLKWIVAWIMVLIHRLAVVLGAADGPGIAWVWAIVGLTVIVRLVVLPLYWKSLKSTRNMAAIQPEMKKIQEKYKGRTDQVSKQQMNQETMALYKNMGVNPMASCFPMLIQMPILIALFRVLASTHDIANGTYMRDSIGPLTQQLAKDFEASTFLGAPLSDTFLNAGDMHTKIVAGCMVVLYMLLMFVTQIPLGLWNIDTSNPMSTRMIKIMAFTMPIMLAFSGVYFQVGVVLYWLVSMLISALQQIVVLFVMPTPNSKAHGWKMARSTKKYAAFEGAKKEEYEEQLASLGVTSEQVDQMWVTQRKAQQRGKDTDVFADVENGEQLREGVDAKEKLEDELRACRIKLDLEVAPMKRKVRKNGKKTLMERAIEAAEEQQKQASGAGRKPGSGQRVQPKNTTRSQRGAQNRQNTKGKGANLSAAELEARREERRKKARQQRKKKS